MEGSISYHSLSQTTRIQRANGLDTQFAYTKAGHRAGIQHLFAANELSYSYQFNGSGQISQKNHLDLASPWLPRSNQHTGYSANNQNQGVRVVDVSK